MSRQYSSKGFALPFALLVILILGIVSTTFTNTVSSGLRVGKSYQVAAEVFAAAEGALNIGIREIVTQPNFWIQREPLAQVPLGYTSYSPVANDSNNGLPLCNTGGCERNFFPTGGGLLKNFGEFGGAGSTVAETAAIADQLDEVDPAPDLTINGIPAWYQIERLDQAELENDAVGVSLDPTSMRLQVRFRVTATARRTLRGAEGTTTIVALVAVNPL